MRDKNHKYVILCLVALLGLYSYNTFKPWYVEKEFEKQKLEFYNIKEKQNVFEIRDKIRASEIQSLKDSIAKIDYQTKKVVVEKPKYTNLSKPKSKYVTNLEAKEFENVDEKRILEIMKKYQK